MRIDLSDLDRLTGFAEALERLFWCLLVLAFAAAVLGSAGTGLLVLVLGAAAFVVRAGLEDFVRSRQASAAPEEPAEPGTLARQRQERVTPKSGAPERAAEPEFTVYRASRRLRRTNLSSDSSVVSRDLGRAPSAADVRTDGAAVRAADAAPTRGF